MIIRSIFVFLIFGSNLEVKNIISQYNDDCMTFSEAGSDKTDVSNGYAHKRNVCFHNYSYEETLQFYF